MKIHQIAGLSIPVDDPVWMADLVLQRTGPLLTLGGGHVLAEWVHTGVNPLGHDVPATQR